jgi:hypothetical protein
MKDLQAELVDKHVELMAKQGNMFAHLTPSPQPNKQTKATTKLYHL